MSLGFGTYDDDYATKTREELDHQITVLYIQLNTASDEIKELNLALSVIKKFCADNGLDLSPLIGHQRKQISEMTKAEIIELNKGVTERQASKVAKSADATPMPNEEEMAKLMKNLSDSNLDQFVKEISTQFDAELAVWK
jgi:hypothetical protein